MGIMQGASQYKSPGGFRKIGTISGSNLSYVAAAATFAGLTYATNGGNVQISSAGVHGLTTSPAAGSRVYVSWSGGTGVNGFYTILTVDTTLAITIDLPYAVGLGTPTVALAGTNVSLAETVTLPGNALGLTKKMVAETMATVTASTNNKTLSILFGGTAINFMNTAAGTVTSANVSQATWNDGTTNSQKSTGRQDNGSVAGTYLTAAVDTTADVTIGIRISLAAANEPAKILKADFYLR